MGYAILFLIILVHATTENDERIFLNLKQAVGEIDYRSQNEDINKNLSSF